MIRFSLHEGGCFTRVGTSNKQMAASELTTMIIERDRARNPWDSLPSGRPIGDGPADAAPNHTYRQRGTTPRDSAASTTGLDGKLEDWTETKDSLPAPTRRGGQGINADAVRAWAEGCLL